MTAETIPLFGVHRVDPPQFEAAGMNLRIGTSQTTHSVSHREWIDGLTLPAPACRQGWCGLGTPGEFTATVQDVWCRKYRRMHRLDAVVDEQQEALFAAPVNRART